MNKIQNIFTDESKLLMYATDASAYREKPFGISVPKSVNELKKIIKEAREKSLSVIPRGAGTSLAGQVVGNGIVVDISRHFNEILEVNTEEKWVRVQPGVVLDELNLYLSKFKLFFGPETSTSNRCVIGGMVGNNSSGLHSLIYGTTRDYILSLNCILSDGSEVVFKSLNKNEFEDKTRLNSLEGKIYSQLQDILSQPENQQLIKSEYPDKQVVRRNTGYALDELLDSSVFDPSSEKPLNLSKLIAGSEGTLAFITEIKLALIDLPPRQKALVCVHFNSVEEAIKGNLVALKTNPGAIELMDNKILELSKENIQQKRNRFFIKGDPGAILIIEYARESMEEIYQLRDTLVKSLKDKGLGYHYPLIDAKDIKKVWDLRKAGLGVLSNMKGDAKSVSVIEDTSVNPERLYEYITEFNKLLKKYKLECVYHAHISVGELHLRPILNLKDPQDVQLFHDIAYETAKLVKRFKGSLSGEHGDGRLRGEFIPIMVGEKIYSWFRDIKKTWDPYNVFNTGKIVDTPAMNTFLRYNPGVETPDIPTIFDFSGVGGIVRATEKCNGSGDCRKSSLIGGTMCPSYMATQEEENTTRARANILREFLSRPNQKYPFDHEEIYKILDLCLSCKACKSECPSNVDIAKIKAEFLQHYYDQHGIPLRTRAIAYINSLNRLGSIIPGIYNYFITNPFISKLLKRILSFAEKRSIPTIHAYSLNKWLKKNLSSINGQLSADAPELYLFIDEFTNYNDTDLGEKTVRLLSSLGYKIRITKHDLSGRSFISKGLLRTARKKALKNVLIFSDLVSAEIPLVGIEPSAILSFRDEYPDFFYGEMKEKAKKLAENVYLIDEFLAREMDKGKIKKDSFSKESKWLKIHGHCQQKALGSFDYSLKVISFPENYTVEEIPSGCCGMAGSFGYEKEHYELSQKIGELVLFPAIRQADDAIIVAPGTSCRHQIRDGTGKKALHPVEVLYDALVK